MAKRIKGITVEIGGDTTKLSKALEGVNKNIKNTKSQLKDVEKLLKLDPKNTELFSQKQKLLADSISATKDKLATLKTAAEQANTALANGDITQQQYDALQREIVETENELKRLESEAKNANSELAKIGEAGQVLQNAGDKISGAGEKLLPITAGVTALGTAAVKTASDFDSAMSKVAAVSGATGDDLQALRDKSREMGSKTKFSASEAAEAMNYMAMAGWKTNDMLSGIDGIMNLAAASGEDLATTSDIVTDALTAFGLTAQGSGHFADVLAAASSNANTNVSMLGESFKYCAPIAGALGFSCEDTAEALGLMANAGIKSTQSGTSMRSIMTALSGDVKFCSAAFGEMEIATSKLNALDPATKQTIIKIGLMAAALGPLLIVVGKTISSIGSMMTFISKIPTMIAGAKTAFSTLGAAIGGISAPVVAVVAVIAVLIAAFVNLWNTNEDFKNSILSIWEQIKSTFERLTSGIVDRINALGFDFESFGEMLKAMWNGLCSVLAPVFEGVFQHISDIFTFMTDTILSVLDVFIGLFSGNWEQCWNGIKGIFTGIWDFVVNQFSNILNTLRGGRCISRLVRHFLE